MRFLELLAPARNTDIGIAAIDCGADAVYIAGPDFGARKAAGNPVEEIERLCLYAHQFGARVFVTFNTIIEDNELDKAHAQMLQAQEAGADAFIIRDMRILDWEDIRIPLHASTQCAIATPERAAEFDRAGCGRVILERELSLQQIQAICKAVKCEVECFVHGALCVCYSGLCRLSEAIDGRSADKGECIQACRSLYDLCDAQGRVLLRNKALLSLKDYNLKAHIAELADAGVCSFKIEGRLKNASYVKNVVREYDLALNALIESRPDQYCRASRGKVICKWQADSGKTFNRGYTDLYYSGTKGQWSSMNAPKSMGEIVGKVLSVKTIANEMELTVAPANKSITLRNGDGFAFVGPTGVSGFRGDICEGRKIRGKAVSGLKAGISLYRNINSAFERTLEKEPCRRELEVELDVRISGEFCIEINARCEDGREILSSFHTDVEKAENEQRSLDMMREQLGRRSGIYSFKVNKIDVETKGGALPLLSASTLNSMRRLSASDLDAVPCPMVELAKGERTQGSPLPQTGIRPLEKGQELMRSRYCVRYELGICPKQKGSAMAALPIGTAAGREDLFLLNNGRKFRLSFDCAKCEMTLSED